MNKEGYMFSQLLDFHERNDFNYLAREYDSNKYVKQFTCYIQLVTLMFGQPSNRESHRVVVLATQALTPKAYALGFGKFVTRSNISKANNSRNYLIFEKFAYQVIAEARKWYATDIFKLGDIQTNYLLEESARRRHQSTSHYAPVISAQTIFQITEIIANDIEDCSESMLLI